MAKSPKDQDEARLERLAKRLLSTPPEPREKAAERGKRTPQKLTPEIVRMIYGDPSPDIIIKLDRLL